MRFCELKCKEVVNACDGKRLGYIVDLILDAIIIPKTGKMCGFFSDGSEYIIPFRCVKKIGEDIILVEIHEEK